MKIVLILFLFLVSIISSVTIKNMIVFDYGVNDAFWRAIWAIDEGTIHSENFNEKAFSKIAIGMDQRDVRKLIGEPLEKYPKNSNEQSWYFTKQETGSSDYDQRIISFNDKGKVIKIVKSFFID